jgi:uncharacterized protein
MVWRRMRLCLLAVAVAALFGSPAWAAEIAVGTGSKTGVYFHVGRAICRLLNEGTNEHGIACESHSTAGSIFNLKNVRAGKLQIAVAQSDWQYHALKGTKRFTEDGPDPKLRALFSAHGEPFTLVARRDAPIRKLDDLVGKRVNIGNPGSGQRATMAVVMEAKGWTEDTFMLAEQLPASQQSLALCHDRIQAMIYTVGHPNASVGKAVGLCDAVIVEVKDKAIDKLVADNPFYAYTDVPGGIYGGNPNAVTTFGVGATVVSSADVDEETIYTVVRTVFENLDRFKRMHPAFGPLLPRRMIRDGLSAPLHPGAVRYFREKGLM